MVIPSSVRAALVEHARAEEPNEACGLLVLRDGVAERYVPGVNAAASLAIAKDIGLREATELAQQVLDSGRARACLERWRTAAQARAARGTG